MKHTHIDVLDGNYVYTDKLGKIYTISCDGSKDFVYNILCKEDELKKLQSENKM